MILKDLIKIFARENIELIPVNSKKEAHDKIIQLIPLKSTVGYGGSVTLEEIGILDTLRKGDYSFIDRTKVTPFTNEAHELARKTQHADYFLSGSNAITIDGKIVNKDRTGNRVSALIYGPEHVIIVIGKNKIVKDIAAALERIEKIAGPLNAKRRKAKTPCVETGNCTNCSSPDRLCCVTVIIERQHLPNRMKIILVDENLGY